MFDPSLETPKHINFDITQVCAVSNFAHTLLHEFRYYTNFNMIKVPSNVDILCPNL